MNDRKFGRFFVLFDPDIFVRIPRNIGTLKKRYFLVIVLTFNQDDIYLITTNLPDCIFPLFWFFTVNRYIPLAIA